MNDTFGTNKQQKESDDVGNTRAGGNTRTLRTISIGCMAEYCTKEEPGRVLPSGIKDMDKS